MLYEYEHFFTVKGIHDYTYTCGRLLAKNSSKCGIVVVCIVKKLMQGVLKGDICM